jgi:hypothetical protein
VAGAPAWPAVGTSATPKPRACPSPATVTAAVTMAGTAAVTVADGGSGQGDERASRAHGSRRRGATWQRSTGVERALRASGLAEKRSSTKENFQGDTTIIDNLKAWVRQIRFRSVACCSNRRCRGQRAEGRGQNAACSVQADQRPWRLRRRQGQQLIAGSRIDPWRRQPRLADAEASIAIDRPFSILAVDGVVPHVRAVVQPQSFGNALAPVKTKQVGRAMAGNGRQWQASITGYCRAHVRTGMCYLLLPSAAGLAARDTRVGYEGARERGSEAIGEIEPGCRDCHVPRVCADPTLTAGAAGRADRAPKRRGRGRGTKPRYSRYLVMNTHTLTDRTALQREKRIEAGKRVVAAAGRRRIRWSNARASRGGLGAPRRH